MAAISSTQQKCKACEKTVYFPESVSADGVLYHKTCFRCSHCNGRLVISRFCSIDGVLYCKPHYEQLYKETGSFSKKLQQSGKTTEKPDALPRPPSKISHLFSGTQEKCAFCNKTAYPLEKLTVEGESYHKSCFRCSHGGCSLTASSYAALDGILYCKHHFSQLFKQKGSYSQLMKSNSSKKFTISPPLSDLQKVEIATEAN
ncbi:hypothetical protein MLD38_039121 [Melastoma candidum]|uniref:Uncharacterized protein n=1 Tax=Melastoma candidum TaxID=119954 RepID=A0ACB9L2L7_9MYRT|nr:hypothetical protein MLD38_039121 [Melastoma candidum]